MTPRASFVIPVYNAECWIAKSVESCLNQSVKQIEVIVVNDASTDSTKEILDTLAKKDKRLIPVHLTENGGSAAARNLGNSKASSEIIMVLDADDMSMRNRAKLTLDFFEKRNPDVVWGEFFEIDAIGRLANPRRIPCQAFIPEMQKKTRLNYICNSTMAYRKGVTLNVPYDTGEYGRLVIYDWKFQWDCFNKGYSMKHIKRPLCYYRSLKTSQSRVRNQAEVDALKDAYFGVTV